MHKPCRNGTQAADGVGASGVCRGNRPVSKTSEFRDCRVPEINRTDEIPGSHGVGLVMPKAFLEHSRAIRLPAMISDAVHRRDTISANAQIRSQVWCSRRARMRPNTAMTNIIAQIGKSPGGTLKEKENRKSGNK